MRVHAAAAGCRIGCDVGVSVELSEELLDGEEFQREHEGLVAVVAGSHVAQREGVGEGDLRDFLAIAEDAEHGAAEHDLTARKRAHLSAAVCDAVVAENVSGVEPELAGLYARAFAFTQQCSGNVIAPVIVGSFRAARPVEQPSPQISLSSATSPGSEQFSQRHAIFDVVQGRTPYILTGGRVTRCNAWISAPDPLNLSGYGTSRPGPAR